ncbi:hypothetical protein B0H11DRAFT_1987795 [Mycena galericulata]|nr:hypothetical protein B0H11DRAFT_1987795 [Mycena galericulata]
MEVINEIRSDNAAPDSDVWQGANPTTQSTLHSLRTNLDRACQSLSEELYTSDAHFILELVQNADDNTYADGSHFTPTLAMSLDLGRNKLVVACNEMGFNDSQVKAICKIGASTKKYQEGYIGEKGIGFKSVFKVADKVFISSGPYKFVFDKHAELGMITPSWAKDCPGRQYWTQFTLQLSSTIDRAQLESYLSNIDPTLLLFLRKLRCLQIDLGVVKFKVQRIDTESGIVSLRRVSGDQIADSPYLLIKRFVKTYAEEKKRPNITRTEIILGFPLASDGSPQISGQSVHAFLPIRKYGFSFLIQGDFLTLANREDILSDSPWNQTLRYGLVSVFLDAIAEFQMRPNLALVWYKYIPTTMLDGFFSPFKDSLMDQLRMMDILQDADGQLRCPSHLLVVPSEYCDDNGEPLIPETFLPPGHHYISSEYDPSDQHSAILYALGVNVLSRSQFIDALSRMNRSSAIEQQSIVWHEAVSVQLRNLKRYSKYQIMALRIVPLQDGSWVSPNSGALFFSSDIVDIPTDLDVRLIATLNRRSSHFSLLEDLGVQQANPITISEKILDKHDGQTPSPPHALTHARFLFAHRDQLDYHARRRLDLLKLLNQNGVLERATNLYMDSIEENGIMPISNIISSPSHFLHQSYLTCPSHSFNYDEWYTWLKDILRVNITPRVINGQFSSEFLEFLTNSNSGNGQILRALKDYWPRLRPAVSLQTVQAVGSRISVICHDDIYHKLNTTALRRGPLKPFSHLQFLRAENPEDKCWDFLGELGVILRPNGSMYLKWLRRLSGQNSNDTEVIASTYKQLEARFNDDPEEIGDAFDEDCLIFVPPSLPSTPGKWISKSDVVWGGPPSLHSKVDLKRSYPQLAGLFRTHLKIPDCPNDMLFHELVALATSSSRSGYAISTEDHRRVSHILDDIGRLIAQNLRSKTAPPSWVSKLLAHQIFPVRVAKGGLQLRKLGENFYIPDKGGKLFEMFKGRVDMLELDEDTPFSPIRVLLQTDYFRQLQSRYLDVAVSCEYSSVGERVADTEIQEDYLMRAPLVQRMLNAEYSRSHKFKKELQTKFCNLTVLRAAEVLTTYTIGDFSHTKTEDLIVLEETERFLVLIRMGCSASQYQLQFCERWAGISGLDRDKLLIVMGTPMEFANGYLDQEGIEQHFAGVSREADDSWTIDMAHGTVETTTTGWKTIRAQAVRTSLTEQTSGSLDRGFDSTQNLIGLNMQMISDAAAQQSLPVHTVNSAAFFASRGEQNTDNELHRNTLTGSEEARSALVSLQPTIGSLSGFFIGGSNNEEGTSPVITTERVLGSGQRTQVSPTEVANGVLGEFFIYETLRKWLPDFTVDNWTSELRGAIPLDDFLPYNVSSVADFQYSDAEGILTRAIFGEDVFKEWAGRWPEYHLEVKSTSNSKQTPFHMSSRQLDLASQFTLPPPGQIPAAVYVLVRVWNIRSNAPSFAFSPDPHRSLYTKSLKILSDVEVVLESV